MTDFDTALHDTLRRAAGEDVHVERLLAGAQATGRRYRRRRRIVAACAGLTAGGLAVAVTMTLLPGTDREGSAPASAVSYPASPPVSPPMSPPAVVSASPTGLADATTWPLPPADNTSTAGASAPAIGQPLLFHLSLSRPPFPFTTVEYQSADDRQESVSADSGDRRVVVRLGATTTDWEPLEGTPQAVDVGGRPGTFAMGPGPRPVGTLRWQTAGGLWLQVYGATDRAEAVAIAASVRTDRTYWCVTPYRLGPLPPGTKSTACSMVFNARGVDGTSVGVSDGSFHASVITGTGNLVDLTDQIGGRPARIREHPGDGGRPILEIGVNQGTDAYVHVTATGRYDGAVVRRIVTDLAWTGGTDPATFPGTPLFP